MQITFDEDSLRARVREVADFPERGVGFKDITPLLADPAAFSSVLDALVRYFGRNTVDVVIGIESRGFILAAPVADRLGAAFVPARKAGRLPGPTHRVAYDLEYGQASLEIHRDAFSPGARVLVLDDVLATGGTAAACVELVEAMGPWVRRWSDSGSSSRSMRWEGPPSCTATTYSPCSLTEATRLGRYAERCAGR